MSTTQMNLSLIQPSSPAPGDPANIILRYFLDHLMLLGAFFSHSDTATIAYLTLECQIELIFVPAQAVPPALGAQRLVRVHGRFTSAAAPVKIHTLAVASSYNLFAADYTQGDQVDMGFDHWFHTMEATAKDASMATDSMVRCVIFPTIMPLPYGHIVVQGLLMDEAVVTSLAVTHPFLGFWGCVLRIRVDADSGSMDQAVWAAILAAGSLPPAMAL